MRKQTFGFVCIVFALVNIETSFAVAPKVVRTLPENGDMYVRPGTVKVRIIFDQDMNHDGYSITGSGEKFPQIISVPQWTAKRTISFTAELLPNHEYEFGINSPSYKNFRNIRGEPAEISAVFFKTAGENGSSGDSNEIQNLVTKEQNRQSIDELKEALKKSYSYNEIKKINWDVVFNLYQPRLLNSKTADEFAHIAALALARAKDKHIWLTVDGNRIPAYINPVIPNVDVQLLQRLVPNFKKLNDIVSTGKFSDRIGYIWISSWAVKDDNDVPTLFGALKDFNDSPALIIDVRGNDGGNELLAQSFAGCFIDKPTDYAMHVTIEPNGSGEPNSPIRFSQVFKRSIHPSKNNPEYRGKIAVLTGPVIMSSCESFVMMLRQVPGCKVIGEPTQGSSGNPKPHTLTNGVTVYLPSWKDMFLDGSLLEGRGIQPDILVKRADNAAGQDNVLDAALKELRKK
jgi:hypothetical protein